MLAHADHAHHQLQPCVLHPQHQALSHLPLLQQRSVCTPHACAGPQSAAATKQSQLMQATPHPPSPTQQLHLLQGQQTQRGVQVQEWPCPGRGVGWAEMLWQVVQPHQPLLHEVLCLGAAVAPAHVGTVRVCAAQVPVTAAAVAMALVPALGARLDARGLQRFAAGTRHSTAMTRLMRVPHKAHTTVCTATLCKPQHMKPSRSKR